MQYYDKLFIAVPLRIYICFITILFPPSSFSSSAIISSWNISISNKHMINECYCSWSCRKVGALISCQSWWISSDNLQWLMFLSEETIPRFALSSSRDQKSLYGLLKYCRISWYMSNVKMKTKRATRQ